MVAFTSTCVGIEHGGTVGVGSDMTDEEWKRILYERLTRIEVSVRPVESALRRLRDVELEQATMRGSIRTLIWFIPAPTAILAGLLVWSITKGG